MLLSARPLVDVVDVNHYRPATELVVNKGDAAGLYFQLVDLEQLPRAQSWMPGGLRYVPSGSPLTLSVEFVNIDAARAFTRFGVQPFAGDGSVWRVDLMASDVLDGTGALRFTLTEGVVVRSFLVPAVLLARDTTLNCV